MNSKCSYDMFATFSILWKLIRYLWSKKDNNMSDTNETPYDVTPASDADISEKCDETNTDLLFRHRIDSALLNSNILLPVRSSKLPTTRHSSGALTPSPPNPHNSHTHSVHRSSYPSGLRVSSYHPLRIGPRLFRDKSSFRY